MPQDVVVVFIHGINTTCQDYYAPLRDRILKRLTRQEQGHVIFRAVFWADIVRGRQQEYLNYAKLTTGFDPSIYHQMVIEGLGDAAAYQKTEKRTNSAYYQIQGRIRKTIRDAALPGKDTRPLVFIAHSLGCHIISSYAWDLHKFKDETHTEKAQYDATTSGFVQSLKKKSPFERLDTFAGFVTMGSNMPLFTFTFGPQYVYPMTHAHQLGAAPAFPGNTLHKEASDKAAWRNYYSSNDPLGYPMKPLNNAYDIEARLTDNATVSEGRLRKAIYRGPFRPLAAMAAHTGYWKDPVVASGAAGLLKDLIHTPQYVPVEPEPQPGSQPILFPTLSAAAATP